MHTDAVAVGFDLHLFLNHCVLTHGGTMDGSSEEGPQAFPCHGKNVQAWLTSRRFQISPGAPMNMHNIAPVVDDDTRRGIAFRQELFRQGYEGGRCLAHHRTGRGWNDTLLLSHAGRGQPQHERCGGRVFPLVQLPALVHHGEEIVATADRLGGPKEQESVRSQRVMQHGQEPLLQRSIQVDQEIAAGEEVQFRERADPRGRCAVQRSPYPEFLWRYDSYDPL